MGKLKEIVEWVVDPRVVDDMMRSDFLAKNYIDALKLIPDILFLSGSAYHKLREIADKIEEAYHRRDKEELRELIAEYKGILEALLD